MSKSHAANQNDESAGETGVGADAATNAAFEARLRAEIERRLAATPAMLHSINEAGLIVSVSDAWLAKVGYERDEVLGRPSVDFLTPESRELAAKVMLPQLFRVGRYECEYQLRKKNGGVIDVLVSAVMADDPGGRGRASLAVSTDITALVEAKRRLVESEARYRSLVEDQSELISLATPEGELRYVNEAYASYYGRRSDEMAGRNILEFVLEEERAEVANLFARVCSGRDKVECENRIVRPDGGTRWFSWTNRALCDADGRVTVVHSVGRDIQERVDAELRLRASEARYRFLAEHSTDMILLVDRHGKRTYASPASRKLLGFEPEDVLRQSLWESIHPEDAQWVLPILAANPADTLLTYRTRRKDGSYIWVETTGKTVEIDGAERQRLIIVRDVSARKLAEDQLLEAHARLEVLSSQDSLTGLANRRIFDKTLETEYRRAERAEQSIAVIMIDVDRFKLFNDRHGHPAGDECLRRIANAIAVSIRRPGDLAARYGGEEFAVVLPGADEIGAMTVAANIQNAVRKLAIEHPDSEWGVATVSIGVASVQAVSPGNALELVLREADRALYLAKNAGRNAIASAFCASAKSVAA